MLTLGKLARPEGFFVCPTFAENTSHEFDRSFSDSAFDDCSKYIFIFIRTEIHELPLDGCPTNSSPSSNIIRLIGIWKAILA